MKYLTYFLLMTSATMGILIGIMAFRIVEDSEIIDEIATCLLCLAPNPARRQASRND